MLTRAFMQHLESRLSETQKTPVCIHKVKSLSGGSINEAYYLKATPEDYFLKMNHAVRFPGMFEAEQRGLEILHETGSVRIPAVRLTGTFESSAFLVLEWVHPGKRNKYYYETLGRHIAQLHRHQSFEFGLDHDNYIGSLPQKNTPTGSGPGFMMELRFRPLAEKAFRQNLLSRSELSLFETFYHKLPVLLGAETPSLLHGDLWNGNVITGPEGEAWLIDPAVYFGYRETDIAMTKLFGGFDASFYDAYNESFPLTPGWEERVALFQLYPLLVHLNLFGGGYREGVIGIIRKYR